MASAADGLMLCAGGDVALGGALEGHLDSPASRAALVAAVRPLFAAADIGFVDLDCTCDTSGSPPRSEGYRITARAAQLDVLAELGVHIVSQANNHAFDHGWISAQRTQAALLKRGISSVGAGADLDQARSPVVLERRGRSVGFLAYASPHPWVDALPAERAAPGVAPLEVELVRSDIRALRRQVDWVVVSVHWGKEYLHYPAPAIVQQGRSFIEAGASVVLGHHPHVIQGVEAHGRGVIAYSLGNFIFPDYPAQGLRFGGAELESLVLSVQLHAAGARIAGIHPVRMRMDAGLSLLAESEQQQVMDALLEYSRALQRPGYAVFWRRQARRRELKRLWRVVDEEVLQAGWRGGTHRLLQLGRKNIRSVGRSLGEILFGAGESEG